jgi:hypothetical protein
MNKRVDDDESYDVVFGGAQGFRHSWIKALRLCYQNMTSISFNSVFFCGDLVLFKNVFFL